MSSNPLVTHSAPRYTLRMTVPRRQSLLCGMALLAVLALTACQAVIPAIFGSGHAEPQAAIASGVSDTSGLARVESAAGVIDFQVASGLTGERLAGVRVRVAVIGQTRLLLAEDATGIHLPVAVPLGGSSTVRRLVMPARSGVGYNLTTAAGPLALDDLEPLGTLTEAQIRERLAAGPAEAVLIYLYNLVSPLALTGAPLEAYATPFENVTVLRAAGEPPDAQMAFVTVSLSSAIYERWSNLFVDRFLAARIGQLPDVDLNSDLAFHWAFPVFEVFPTDLALDVSQTQEATLRVSWRSQNPDPPAPWSFFLSTNDPRVSVDPTTFALGPDSVPVEVQVRVNAAELPVGEYQAAITFQPFSDSFGLIEQSLDFPLTYTMPVALPTSTPARPVQGLTVEPPEPIEGERVVIIASGFDANETVLFEFVGPDRSIRDLLPKADGTGVFRYEVDLSTVPAGEYAVRLQGTVSGVIGETTVTVRGSIPDGIVASDELNLRAGPGYDFPVVEVLLRGDELEALSTNYDNSWVEVESPTGRRGWVVADLATWNVSLTSVPFHEQYGRPPP